MKPIKTFIYSVIDIFFPRGIPRIINGTTIRFPAKWSRLFRDGFEKDNFEFAKQCVPIGGTVLDIGAHIGVFSVYLSTLTGKKGKVYAFEPTPYTFGILNKIIKLNRGYGGEIVACPFAVNNKAGEINFNIIPGTAYVANSLVNVKNTVSIKVKMISIDEFCNEKQLRIDFMKIDAEGAEFSILSGAKKTFMIDRPRAHLGLHPWQIKAMGNSLDQIWDLLIQYKLKVQLAGKPITKEWFCSQVELFDVELTPQ